MCASASAPRLISSNAATTPTAIVHRVLLRPAARSAARLVLIARSFASPALELDRAGVHVRCYRAPDQQGRCHQPNAQDQERRDSPPASYEPAYERVHVLVICCPRSEIRR